MRVVLVVPLASVPAWAGGPEGLQGFRTQVFPLVERHCGSCHGAETKKGDLGLTTFKHTDEPALLAAIDVWRAVAERLEAGEMPPEDKPRPTPAEAARISSWVKWAGRRAAAAERRDPGRVTIRRLNRAEYNNTVRDLLGLDLKPADDFPSDDVGYGFDNIGDVLSMPPILVERYLIAADRIARAAIVAEVEPKPRARAVQVERLAPTPAGSMIRDGALLMTGGTVGLRHTFPADAEYTFRIKARGRHAGRLALRVDGEDTGAFAVGSMAATGVRGLTVPVLAGDRRVELALAEPRGSGRRIGQVGVDWLKIVGPFRSKPVLLPESHTRVIPRPPQSASWRHDARELLAMLATRAYRRPATTWDIDRLVAFVEAAVAQGDTFERGMQVALRAVLVSPHFLYRVELDPGGDPETPARRISDYELASRLSYFLWSSMPDDELFRLAAAGTLGRPEVIETQAMRMLRDPKAEALGEGFATQWLQIRPLATHRASRRTFPSFDERLRGAMMRETELFFASVVREDRPLLTLLDADFTYVNDRLARHYGIDGVVGPDFRRVSLAGTPRGGVLTQASVLTVTSNPTRTSPVKRGRWVLEQLLDAPPPPPPGPVPELEEQANGPGSARGTLRQQMEQHRKDPACAVCHRKMDALGFGLEGFDAIGAFRTHEADGLPIDASGVLPTGQSFAGPAELKAVLRSKAAAFRRCLAEKLLTYAIGRGTEKADRFAVDEISDQAAMGGGTFSALALAIVKSDPFLMRSADKGATP